MKRPRVITQQQREALGAIMLTWRLRDKSLPLIELPGDEDWARRHVRAAADAYVRRLREKVKR